MRRIVVGEDARVGPWICERLGSSWTPGTGWTLGMERDGRLIGAVLYDTFLGRSLAMHVAGEGGHWVTREFARAAFAYPFRQLGVHKVLGLVDSTNAAARRFDEHLGFVLEAVIAGAGRVGDLLVYSMTPAQCRFLEA